MTDPTAPPVRRDRLHRLSRYASVARFAPSKHNSQPWRFALAADGLQVWADRARRTGVTDPDERELLLACGAAVLAAQLAAEADGVRLGARLWPDGGDGPVAVLEELGTTAVTVAARRRLVALLRRRTDRGPLDASRLPPQAPARLEAAAAQHGCVLRLLRTDDERAVLRRLVAEADAELLRDPAVRDELDAWTVRPVSGRRDGVPATATRGTAGAPAAFVQRDFSLPGTPAAHDRDGRDDPLVGVLCSPTDSPADRLRAGGALLEVLVAATLDGAGASYLNQPIELPRTRVRLREELALAGTPQLVLRLGVGGTVPPTPRRGLPDVLVLPGARRDR